VRHHSEAARQEAEDPLSDAKEVAELLGQHLAHIQQPSQTLLRRRPLCRLPSSPSRPNGKAQPRGSTTRPVRMAVIVLAIARCRDGSVHDPGCRIVVYLLSK